MRWRKEQSGICQSDAFFNRKVLFFGKKEGINSYLMDHSEILTLLGRKKTSARYADNSVLIVAS